jgi:hypothetical protein
MEALYGDPTRTSAANNLPFVYSNAFLSEMLQSLLSSVTSHQLSLANTSLHQRDAKPRL